jgi:N6-adenosine-specific RNA methylase IME4
MNDEEVIKTVDAGESATSGDIEPGLEGAGNTFLSVFGAMPARDIGWFRLNQTSLVFKKGTPYQVWYGVMQRLQVAHEGIQWWIGDAIRFGEAEYGEMYLQAIENTPYTYGTLRNMKRVAEQVPLSLRNDSLPYKVHEEVVPLMTIAPQKAAEILDKAEAEALHVREVRSEVREAMQAINRARRVAEITARAEAGVTYPVILADPPWEYDFSETESREIENRYPTMTVQELSTLGVGNLAGEDAVLFLWAPNPKLMQALAVMQDWGFEYKTNLVWVKDKTGMGYWVRGKHELLLVGKRGNIPVPIPAARPESVLVSPGREQSQKPDEVYEIIKAMYPDLPRLELFARRAREGWERWGLETPL